MGSRALVTMVATLAASAVMAQDAPPKADAAPAARPARPPVVYLYGTADLEKLKAANPSHYWRAERIIAASDELCKPGPEEVYYARFEAKEISCASMLLKTSNPPKREIGFTLDDVRYVAVVTITDAKPRFRRVPADVVPPVEPAK